MLPPTFGGPFQGNSTTSASDILTALKNIVTALNNQALYTLNAYKNLPIIQLAQAVGTTTLTAVYTANSASTTHLNSIYVCNTTGSATTFSICLVPSGGTAGAANALFFSAAIAANATLNYTAVSVLPAGGSIYVSCGTASAVTFTITGGTTT
jgi:hypothetical protein